MKSNRPWLALLSELYAAPSPEEARLQNESYGDLLVDLGIATRKQVDACLAAPHEKGRPFPRLSRMLIDQGVITREQLAGSVIASAAEDPENRVGRYILLGRLRDETWKAWDTARRDWAQVTFVSPVEQARLRARAAVAHPGLAAILEVDPAFVAMEHVEGMTLATAPRADRRKLLEAVRDAAVAIGALHAKKLIHGAVSLETILIDARGRVRVIGWGADDRDVPALGAALYEVLTDRSTQGVPKTWPKRLDQELRAVLTKALENRYASAAAFAKDLA
jgi:hypothetical protein